MDAEPRRRTFRPRHPTSLRLTLAPLARGRFDPTTKVDQTGAWRATRTPLGPGTIRLTARAAAGEVTATAWGPGADWLLDQAPVLVGAGDDPAGFAPRHPVVRDLHRRLPGLRIPRTQAVFEAVVPTVCEQKVVGIEAKRSYRGIVQRWGEPAPGPAAGPRLRVPPSPAVISAQPGYAFHPLGLERKRADTIRRAAASAGRLEETSTMAPTEARRRLAALAGLGPWSAAEVAIVALGDADAVSVGDYHLPDQVSYALTGEPRGDDARMLALLEPYRGHRGRVIRLIVAGLPLPPRRGPRLALRGLAAH